ncbi:YcjF family protein [Telmatospirillum siberiense]|uniref:DUF697 domain-containing protein n=1 Tax=Telmatospirillum siberiense TaxID=382514 RepID=A0A2N3PP82_9PROT|nr:DUF697 domain-containing protein [Telmatospirillum siberiense]PKU22233.1 hypothetical protein CWS72_22455 [Telmatospirillum siberiense]
MPQEQTAPPPTGHTQTSDLMRQRLRADACIRTHVIAAMGFGLIPSAVVDIVVISGIETKMIRDLAGLYGLSVPHRLVAYKLLLSLIGGVGVIYFSNKMEAALKGLPLVGYALYYGAFSITGGAAVYAVGKTFQKHYETGETFLESGNDVVRAYFKSKFREGKQFVPSLLGPTRLPAAGV